MLFLRQPSRAIFLDYVARNHPDKLAAYERAFSGSGYLSTGYRNEISARVRAAAVRHGLGTKRPANAKRLRPAQLSLRL